MNRPFRRGLAGLAVALTTAFTAAACNSSPGAAAIVGDDQIEVQALQQVVDRALADPQAQAQLGGDRAQFTRTELARLINNIVVSAAAAQYGITVTEADVDKQIAAFAQQAGGEQQLEQQAAAGGVPKEDLRSFIRFYVTEQKLADKLVAGAPVTQAQLQAAYQKNIDQYDQVHAAHILVKDKATADSILTRVQANPSSFAALASQYSIDTSNKDKGGDLGFAGRSAFVKPFSDAIFAAKPGSFIEVQTQYGWHVVHVIAHKVTPLSAVESDLRATILKDQRTTVLQQALAAEARKLGVHVNPRYGEWNSLEGQIAPPTDSISSPAPSPSGSPAAPGPAGVPGGSSGG